MLLPEQAILQHSYMPTRHRAGAGWTARDAGCPAPLPAEVAAAHDATLRLTPIHLLGTGRLCGADVSLVLDQPAARSACLSPAEPSLVEAACREACAWQAEEARPDLLRLSVPLPVSPAKDRGLAASIRHVVESADLPAGALELTLAEEDSADQSRELLLFVSALRDLGAGVALASTCRLQQAISVLRRLPLTSVRLHPSLVERLSCETETRTLLRQTIRMAHGLGASTLALGVTTQLQRDILADMRCDEVQGTLYDASPLVPSDFRSGLAALV